MGMSSRALLCVASLAGLTACAGGMERSSYVAPTRVDHQPGNSGFEDSDYVSRVEQLARRRGVDVQWVNLPVKRRLVAEQ